MKGAIYCEQAYAQGKMLDHSEWAAILPRGITPSDVDMVCDNRGRIIFCELSSQTHLWNEISTGQRLLYESLVWGGKHLAALLWHQVKDRKINTRRDVLKFSVMFYRNGSIKTLNGFVGSDWQNVVTNWYGENGPDEVLRDLLKEWTAGN